MQAIASSVELLYKKKVFGSRQDGEMQEENGIRDLSV
jgi:hypothetical protein